MRAYTIHNQNIPYFLTWTIVDWIDIFTRQRYREIIIESLKYCVARKGLVLHAYVIMSNHMHLIVNASQGFALSDIIRDCKKIHVKNDHSFYARGARE
jgi:REP element-mobilizing transposase RayT